MRLLTLILLIMMMSCDTQTPISPASDNPLIGTWELISGTTTQGESIEHKDLTNKKMIKIINETHFAFFNHDINIDSLSYYVSGGGEYTLFGETYTESLEYCTARQWEGHTFEFKIEINGDTLTQKGVEKIKELNVDREIVEIYLRAK